MASAHVLDEVREKFENFVKKPENYLKVQNELADNIKVVIKTLYDYTKSVEDGSSGDALPELIIQDFDEEQIWQQLELQNEAVLSKFIDEIAFFTARKKRLQFPTTRGVEDATLTAGDNSENQQSSRHSTNDSIKGHDDKLLPDHGHTSDAELDSEDDHSSDHVEEEEAEETARQNKKGKESQRASVRQKTSIVDDKFFKLGEMADFLDKEDRKESFNNRLNSKKKAGDESDGQSDDDDDDDDIESIDYFEDMPSEDSNDEESAVRAKYGDFFDEPDSGGRTNDQKHSDDKTNGKNNKRSVRFSLPAEEEGEEEEEEEDDDDDDDGRNSEQMHDNEIKSADTVAKKSVADSDETSLSSLERRKARLDEKVARLEEQALSDKPWQLKGEVGAETRPHNSLLEEAVEFDSVTRPAPVRTEKTTLKLEDIIKQRIKDRAWDDVVRKQKPVESPHEYRKRLILDQEKSKLSLAEVYEQEYLKQKEKISNDAAPGQEKPEEEPAEHREIRTLMTSLFSKLDALSNFHYTPKMVAPEVKVVTNLPAVSVEEVAPAATSDATLLAPEEVKSKPPGGGDIASTAEKTATDRKRERRRKKMAQKKRSQRMVEKQKVAGVLVRGSNVSKLEDSGADRGIKSSTAFFNKLQDEVKSQVQRLSAAKRNASVAHTSVNAKKLKL